MSVPEITVAIPTLGERRSLLDTLRSVLGDLAASGIDAEVLVVWNGRERRPTWAPTLPDPVREVLEARRGAARARNAALRRASGAFVLFVDDDMTVGTGWVTVLSEALRHGADVVGGPYAMRWPRPKPSWMPPEGEALLGAYSMGSERRLLVGQESLLTGNLGVRREVARALGGFDEALGHGAGTLLMGEDLDFCWRALRAGLTVQYEPRAVADHNVSIEELGRFEFLRGMFVFGRTMSHLRSMPVQRLPLARRLAKVGWLLASAPFRRCPITTVGQIAFLSGDVSILLQRKWRSS